MSAAPSPRGGVSTPINLCCRGLFHSSLIRTIAALERRRLSNNSGASSHTACQSCDQYDQAFKPKRDGLTGLEVLLRLRRDDIIKVYERSLLIQEDREAAAGSLGLIRGALSLPLDPSAGDLEAIAEELGPAGAKLLKEIYEEQAADAAPDL